MAKTDQPCRLQCGLFAIAQLLVGLIPVCVCYDVVRYQMMRWPRHMVALRRLEVPVIMLPHMQGLLKSLCDVM